MIRYIILSSLIWGVSVLLYTFVFRNEKYFNHNRIFLLVTILLGLVIPLIPNLNLFQSDILSSMGSNLSVNLPELTITGATQQQLNSDGLYIYLGIVILYSVGVIITSITLIRSIFVLRNYRNRGKTILRNGYKLVIIEETIVAFSFLSTIYINKDIYNSPNKTSILSHEVVHVAQGHSYDILLLEILKVVFWFNPIVYVFRILINETHEYIADNYVIQKISKKTYGELLINQLQSGVQYNIANYFINSLIKNRIKMMYKTKSKRKWKYLIAFPVIVSLILLVNACDSSIDAGQSNSITQQNKGLGNDKAQIYQIAEEMPRFPGCENDNSLSEDGKSLCSNKKLYQYIYRKLKYPKQAMTQGIEGKVVVKFVVDKSGKVKNIVKLHDIGGGCGDAVVKVFEQMKDIKWIPGKQGGKDVSVFYTLPVVFKLDSN